MSQQVDFYVLAGADNTARLAFACRIANKAFQQGLQIYLQTGDATQSELLDEMLWSFSPTSFLPHAQHVPGNKVDVSILIGDIDPPEDWNELLISLTNGIPPTAAKFDRIADLIGDDEEQKQAGRNRFRAYRENGVEPTTHKI